MSVVPSPIDSIDPEILHKFRAGYHIPPAGTELQAGSASTSDGTLEKICAAFATVPFENLTKIIKNSVMVASEKKKRLPGEVLRDFRVRGRSCIKIIFESPPEIDQVYVFQTLG